MGVVKIPYPATGCGKDVRVDYDSTTKDPLILLVLRGDCSFLEKVENGQRLKAQLVIIVDNLDEEMTHVLPWSEGAPSLDIQIPSIVIDNKSGFHLMNDTRSLEQQKSSENVIVSVSFRIQQQAISSIFYKFDLNDRSLYESFFELLNFYPGVKKHISVIPSYNVGPAPNGVKSEGLFCLNGTTFCEKREDNLKVSRENQPLFESLRQICLSRIDMSAWWNYVAKFYIYCQGKHVENGKTILMENLDKCSKDILKEFQDQGAVEASLSACMSGVKGDNVELSSKLNEYLLENYNVKAILNTPVQPVMMVNGQIIYGRMASLDILKEICASLSTKPDDCKEIDKLQVNKRIIEMQRFSFGQAVVYLLKLLFIGVVLTAAFYIIYKIKLRKEMETKHTEEVDSALSNYYMQNKQQYQGVQVDADNGEHEEQEEEHSTRRDDH